MARRARVKSDTGIYNVLLRSKTKIFQKEDDRKFFSELIKKYFLDSQKGKILGYRITPKKVMIIAEEKESTVAQIIKPLCTSYARYINRAYGGEGKIFYGRFKSEPVNNKNELASLLSYIYKDAYKEYEEDEIIKKEDKLDITKAKRKLFMDDYENMTQKELLEVIRYLCSDVSGFEKMSPRRKQEEVISLDTEKRLRVGLIQKALGRVPKSAPKKPLLEKKETKEENKPKKQELSVWLL